MRISSRGLVALLLTAFVAVVAAPSASASVSGDAGWQGDRWVQPKAYSWLGPSQPSDTYSIAIVRGIGKKEVLRILGGVDEELGAISPGAADAYLFEHLDPHTFEGPRVAQVVRHGKGIVVYQPSNFLARREVARLSKHGVAAEFITTVELDTYATVGRKGKVVRQFDVFFKPPKQNALPAEQGLDFGAKHQNVWATGWAFNERLTRIHLAKKWFYGEHSTYVLQD